MKRGFLNTSQYKRAIDEAYAPWSPPGPESSRQLSAPRCTQDGGDIATATTDVKSTVEDAPETATMLPSLDGDKDTTAEPPSEKADPKGKGKAKAVDTDDDGMAKPPDGDPSEYACLTRVPPRPLGWGLDIREKFLHTVPKSHGGPRRKRAIFRRWPRAPNGQPIEQTRKPEGKVSPDGYAWAATLYDLYSVRRLPDCQSITFMTGSALLQEMEKLGELDIAKPEIEWAMSEGKLRDEGVADTAELIKCRETAVRMVADYNCFSYTWDDIKWNDKENGDDEDHEKEEEASQHDNKAMLFDDTVVDPTSIPPPPTIPVTSPFHPIHYPKPWPLVPFEKHAPILLQERIPLHLLPRTLYVHDPFNVLPARERRYRDMSWNSRPDNVRTYDLKLSSSVRKDFEEARKRAEELEEFKARTLVVLRFKRTEEQIKNYEPVIEVPLPPYLRHVTKTDESHLYLSPIAKAGNGHHSIVYKAEWELPRDLFVRPHLCAGCFKESADKEIQRLKDTGRWAKLLKAAAWGPTGHTGRQPTLAELDAVNEHTHRDGEIIEREIICVVPPNAPPSSILGAMDEGNVWDVLLKKRNAYMYTAVLDFARSEDGDEDEPTEGSYVAIIRIDPPFSYESQETCTHRHMMDMYPIPRTAMFTVIAKLSLEDDPHLMREARNYQQFPEHFFHHYNGYTIINQLRAVVPVHAIVPQFYGYYVPQKGQEDAGYLSPILLLERCGEPVDPKTLSFEDQQECMSMVLRFQHAGWLHDSLAPRNFLVQRGKPTEFPLFKQTNPEPSFRLIDFGRSRKWESVPEKMAEEMDAMRMFEKMMGSMAITSLEPDIWSETSEDQNVL